MRYAGITYNDIVNCPGIAVSIYLQGCDLHCPGCHNASIWDFAGGKVLGPMQIEKIKQAICANGIMRSLCILGGEPLAKENIAATRLIVQEVRKEYPDIKIYVWTGYVLETLKYMLNLNPGPFNDNLDFIFHNIDYLIDGPFVQEERDVSLFMRGSRNQRVIDMKTQTVIDKPENLQYNNYK